jgi:hypothetical protein
LVALVFGVTAALVAHSKGRSSVGWFLCGLVIGPFAFIVAALPCVVRPGRFIKCRTCGEVIQADANLCRYCRTELEPEGVLSDEDIRASASWR